MDTRKFSDWVMLSMIIAKRLNEEGRELFHDISRQNPGYQVKATDTTYSRALSLLSQNKQ